MSSLPGIDSLGDLTGKKVLVRSDLNVPLDGGRITDDARIRASLPTWQQLLDAGARDELVDVGEDRAQRRDPLVRLDLRALEQRAQLGHLLHGRQELLELLPNRVQVALLLRGLEERVGIDALRDGH